MDAIDLTTVGNDYTETLDITEDACHDSVSSLVDMGDTQSTQIERESGSAPADDNHQSFQLTESVSSTQSSQNQGDLNNASGHPSDQFMHRVTKYLGRSEVAQPEPTGFVFAQAPRPTVNYGRRNGQPTLSAYRKDAAPNAPDLTSTCNAPNLVDGLSSKTVGHEETSSKASSSCNAQLVEDGSADEVSVVQIAQDSSKRASDEHVPSFQARPVASPSLQNSPSLHVPGEPLSQAMSGVCGEVKMSHGQQAHQSALEESHVKPILQVWPGTLKNSTQKPGIDTQQENSKTSRPGSADSQRRGHGERPHPAAKPSSQVAQPLEVPRVPSGISRSRRKTRLSRTLLMSTDSVPLSTEAGSTPSQEELLTFMLFRARQDKLARDTAKQAKEAELEEAKAAYELLRQQLGELTRQDRAQKAALSKYEKCVPALKVKARKLQEYLVGLSNDHNNLRDDAVAIQEQQKSLQTNRQEVSSSVCDVQKVLQTTSVNSSKVLMDARHEIDRLRRSLDDQKRQVEQHVDRLRSEEERNSRLQQKLSDLSRNQQQMVEIFQAQGEVITKRLADVLDKSLDAEQIPPEFRQQIGSSLHRCIELLSEIKDTEQVTPQNLKELDTSIKGYTEHLRECLKQLAETSSSAVSTQAKFGRCLKKQLEDMRTSLSTEVSLLEEMKALREAKVTLQMRAQANETALIEARQTISTMQVKEHSLIQEVSDLKAQVQIISSKTLDDSALSFRLNQKELLLTELQLEVAQLKNQKLQQDEQLKSNAETITNTMSQRQGIQTELEDARATVTALKAENAASEALYKAKYENLKSQLLEAANAERNILANEHSTALEQMRCKKMAAESKAKGLEEEVMELKITFTNEIQSLAKVQGILKATQSELRMRDEQIAKLQDELQSKSEKSQKDQEQKRGFEQLARQMQARLTKVETSLSETEARLASAVSEYAAVQIVRLTRINSILQRYSPNFVKQPDIDAGFEALSELLQNLNKQNSKDEMLDDVLSIFNGSCSPMILLDNPNSPLSMLESLDTMLDNGSPITLLDNPNSPQCRLESLDTMLDDGESHPGQQELTTPLQAGSAPLNNRDPGSQRSDLEKRDVENKYNNKATYGSIGARSKEVVTQVEETTLHRNFIARKTIREGDYDTVPSCLTPPGKPTQISDGTIYPQMAESPDFDTTDLFPTTPVQPSATAKLSGSGKDSLSGEGDARNENTPGHSQAGPSGGESQPIVRPKAPEGTGKPLKRRLAGIAGMTPEGRTSKRQATTMARRFTRSFKQEILSPNRNQKQEIASPSRNHKTGKSARTMNTRRVSSDKFARRFHGEE